MTSVQCLELMPWTEGSSAQILLSYVSVGFELLTPNMMLLKGLLLSRLTYFKRFFNTQVSEI